MSFGGQNSIFILIFLSSLQGILGPTERFLYNISEPIYHKITRAKGFTIQLQLDWGVCELDIYLSRAIISPSYMKQYESKVDIVKETAEELQDYERCSYTGQIHEKPNTWIAVSDCGGRMRGVVYDERGTFKFENGSSHEMFISNVDNESEIKFICGKQNPSMRMGLLGQRDYKRDVRDLYGNIEYYVEMVVVVDNHLYLAMNEDNAAIHDRIKLLINIVNAIYQEFKIFVIVQRVEILTSNSIDIQTESTINFEKVGTFVQKYFIGELVADNVQFLTTLQIKDPCDNTNVSVGMAKVGGMCKENSSFAVICDEFPQDVPLRTALILAYELGHNLAVADNDKEKCSCGRSTCNTQNVSDKSPWGVGSSELIKAMLRNNSFPCLNNDPARYAMLRNNSFPCLNNDPASTTNKKMVHSVLIFIGGVIVFFLILRSVISWYAHRFYHQARIPYENVENEPLLDFSPNDKEEDENSIFEQPELAPSARNDLSLPSETRLGPSAPSTSSSNQMKIQSRREIDEQISESSTSSEIPSLTSVQDSAPAQDSAPELPTPCEPPLFETHPSSTKRTAVAEQPLNEGIPTLESKSKRKPSAECNLEPTVIILSPERKEKMVEPSVSEELSEFESHSEPSLMAQSESLSFGSRLSPKREEPMDGSSSGKTSRQSLHVELAPSIRDSQPTKIHLSPRKEEETCESSPSQQRSRSESQHVFSSSPQNHSQPLETHLSAERVEQILDSSLKREGRTNESSPSQETSTPGLQPSDSQLVTETQWNSEKKEETEQSSSSPETCRRTSLPTFQSSQSDLQLSETHSNLVSGEEIAQPSTSGVIPKRESNIERAQSAQSETHFSRRSEEEIRTSPEDESWMKPPPPTDTSSAPEIRLCDTPESIKHARRHRFQSALSASSESSCPSSDPPVYSDTSSREGIQRTISPGRTTSISPLETHSDPERNIHPPRSLQNPSSVSSVSHPSPHLPVYSEISNPAIPIPKASSLEIPPSPSGCEHNTMRECSSLPSVPESLSIQLRRSRARSRLDDLQQLETLSEQERVPSSEFHYLSPPPKYENIYGLPEWKLLDPPNSKKTDLPDPVIFHRSRVPSLADSPSIPNSPSIADAVFGGSEQSTTDSVPVVSPSEPSDGPSSEILSSPISDEQMPSSSREEIFQPGPQNHSNAGNESQFAKSSSSQELPPLCSGREPVRASYSLPSEIHLNQQISDEQVPESSSSQEIQTGISTFERSTDLLQRETQSDPERDNQTYRSLSTKATMQSSDSKCENYCLQPEPHLESRDDTLPRSLTSSNTSFSETQEGTLYMENEIKTGLTSNDLQPSEIHSHERAESLSSSEQWSTTSIDPQSTETDWTPTEETRLESLTSEEIINTPSPPLHQHSSPIQKDDPTPAVSKNVETQSFQSDSIRKPSSSSDLQTLKTHADSRADIEKGESFPYQRISLKPSSSAPASLHHLAQSKAQSDPRASDRTPLGTKISVSSPSKCKPLILSDSKLSRHKSAITSSSREISMPDSDNVVPTRSDSAPPIIRSSRRNHGGSNEDRMQLEASSLETPLELESPTPSDVLPSEPRASSREDV